MPSPILTISLLCPGRTEDVFKTLDSIKPILEKVSSELIIVDTGCPDELKKRLEEYTDKIIPFSWTGDFAEARNVGLDAAKGQWFMYIDDDEWFDDVHEIIDFFNSGAYKNADYATYYQRNYRDYEKKEYHDAIAYRLFRLVSGHRFVSKIHEYYSGTGTRVTILNTYVNHFGYIFKTKEEKIKHSLRNITPLKEMIVEEPDNMHARYQMIQELFTAEDWQELVRFCDETISMNENKNTLPASRVCSFYIGRVLAANGMGDSKKTETYYYEALQYRKITEYAKARLYALGVPLLEKSEEYKRLDAVFEDYFKLYKRLSGSHTVRAEQEGFFIDDPFDKQVYRYMTEHAMLGYIRNDSASFEDLFNGLDWNEAYTDAATGAMVVESVKLLKLEHLTERQKKNISSLYSKIVCGESTGNIFRGEITKYADDTVILRNIAEVQCEDNVVLCLKAKERLMDGDYTNSQVYLEKAANMGADIINLENVFYDHFYDGNLDIRAIIEATDKRSFLEFVRKLISVPNDEVLDKLNLLLDNIREGDTRFIYALKSLIEYQLVNTPEEDFQGYADIKDVFAYWSEMTIKFYANYFKPEVFVNGNEMLPEDCVAAIKINSFIALAQKDVRLALEELKAAAKFYKNIAAAVKTLTVLYTKNIG